MLLSSLVQPLKVMIHETLQGLSNSNAVATALASGANSMLQLCCNSTAVVPDYDLVRFCHCMVTTAHKQVQLGINAKPDLLPAVLLQTSQFGACRHAVTSLNLAKSKLITARQGKLVV